MSKFKPGDRVIGVSGGLQGRRGVVVGSHNDVAIGSCIDVKMDDDGVMWSVWTCEIKHAHKQWDQEEI